MTVPLKTILDTPWAPQHYEAYGADQPLIIGRASPALLDAPKQKLNDMHVKDKGNNDYQIPAKIIGQPELMALVRQVHQHQKTVNERIEDFHVYVTVSQSPVKKATSQRRAGIHIDGVQGAKWTGYNYKPDRHYIVCSALPTIYHLGKFALGPLDMAQDNLFTHLRQCLRDNPAGFTQFTPQPYDICFMHAYHAHEVARAAAAVSQRTFVRITYSQLVYDRLGNTVNPLIKNDWDWPLCPLTFEMIKKQAEVANGGTGRVVYGGRLPPTSVNPPQ